MVSNHAAVVFVFLSPYCPTSNALTPEVNKVAAEYGNRFKFYVIEAESYEEAAKLASECPTLLYQGGYVEVRRVEI